MENQSSKNENKHTNYSIVTVPYNISDLCSEFDKDTIISEQTRKELFQSQSLDFLRTFIGDEFLTRIELLYEKFKDINNIKDKTNEKVTQYLENQNKNMLVELVKFLNYAAQSIIVKSNKQSVQNILSKKNIDFDFLFNNNESNMITFFRNFHRHLTVKKRMSNDLLFNKLDLNSQLKSESVVRSKGKYLRQLNEGLLGKKRKYLAMRPKNSLLSSVMRGMDQTASSDKCEVNEEYIELN